MRKYIFGACCFLFFCVTQLYAEEIVFKNGDHLTATVLDDSKNSMTVTSTALGTVTIDRSFIASPAYEEKGLEKKASEGKKTEWSRKASLGYSRSGGNTVKKEMNTSLYINRKTDHDEAAVRVSTYYSSSDRKMDSQKVYGMTRYSFSFGNGNSCYNFYKLEADHDRFADVDYRLIPSVGVGKWISDTERWKLLGEVAGGAEYTNYRSGKSSTTDFVLIPRGYFKKAFAADLWAEQDLTAYFTPDELIQYRLRSESSLLHKITEQLSWKLSFIDDYDADPAGSAKKNDYRMIYSLDYSF